jgi:hypothetical protein
VEKPNAHARPRLLTVCVLSPLIEIRSRYECKPRAISEGLRPCDAMACLTTMLAGVSIAESDRGIPPTVGILTQVTHVIPMGVSLAEFHRARSGESLSRGPPGEVRRFSGRSLASGNFARPWGLSPTEEEEGGEAARSREFGEALALSGLLNLSVRVPQPSWHSVC